MSDYDLSPEAREEIREIWDFISRDNEEAADRWILRLLEAFDLLARNSHIGHTRKDLTDQPVLFWPVENYLIIYKPLADDTVEILAVTQGARDIPSYLRRRN
jgi:plasmid stabilization system protein ParE